MLIYLKQKNYVKPYNVSVINAIEDSQACVNALAIDSRFIHSLTLSLKFWLANAILLFCQNVNYIMWYNDGRAVAKVFDMIRLSDDDGDGDDIDQLRSRSSAVIVQLVDK